MEGSATNWKLVKDFAEVMVRIGRGGSLISHVLDQYYAEELSPTESYNTRAGLSGIEQQDNIDVWMRV
jgi:hypothetical protein